MRYGQVCSGCEYLRTKDIVLCFILYVIYFILWIICDNKEDLDPHGSIFMLYIIVFYFKNKPDLRAGLLGVDMVACPFINIWRVFSASVEGIGAAK